MLKEEKETGGKKKGENFQVIHDILPDAVALIFASLKNFNLS